uniref:Uncharacterized protein n=1 Tax=Zea mays TaxID=4577 RepID=B8A0G8_MAIZE|nr:unknown [Zea mays]
MSCVPPLIADRCATTMGAGGRHGARGGQAPPGRAEGGVGACLRGGSGRAGGGARAGGRGAAVGREGRSPCGARDDGAGGAGRVRPRGARGQGPLRAVRARGGAPGRLRLALAERPAGVPARRGDRRAHRRALGRQVQQGGRSRRGARLRGGQVPPRHPHRTHRQGVFVGARGRAAGRGPVVCVCVRARASSSLPVVTLDLDHLPN